MSELFVTGRVCLFGEHSDWAGQGRRLDAEIAPGACLVVGTDQGIHATAVASDEFVMTSRLPDGSERGPFLCPMNAIALRRVAAAAEFFSYAAGVAAIIAERFTTAGVEIRVTAIDLPVQRGLSSSAAACVMVARAFNQVHGLGLSRRDEMEIAYQGELLTGSQCGRMDQTCAFGRTPVLLRFDGDTLDIEALRIGAPIHLLIVDLCRRKDTRRILADLHEAFGLGVGRLRQALGVENLAVIAAACAALLRGDAAALGGLMRQAQALFDECVAPACPAELTAPKLHEVLAHPAAQELGWGGKGVGSQGDGTAQIVCRDAAARERLAKTLEAECGVHCLPLSLGVTAGE